MIAYTVAISDDFEGANKSPVQILSDVMTCLINAFFIVPSCISIDYEMLKFAKLINPFQRN